MAVDCCTMIYKLRDAQKEQNNEDEARLLKDMYVEMQNSQKKHGILWSIIICAFK